MTPQQINGQWFVVAGDDQLAGPFRNNGEAWRWIDRHDGEPINRSEKVSEWMLANRGLTTERIRRPHE